MEIIENKKYSVNTINKVLSFGLKRNGAKIQKGILEITEVQSSFSTKIKISHIREIHYNGVGVVYEIKCFYQKNRKLKSYFIPLRNLSANSWRELFSDLAILNPDIVVSDEVCDFMHQEFVEEYEWKFDFTYTSSNDTIIRRKKMFQQYTYLSTIEIIFGVFLIVPIFFGIPLIGVLLGDHYFTKTIGDEYSIYKNILIGIGALGISFSIVNVLAAIFSNYLGHKVTIVFTIIGCLLMGLGYFLE